MTPRRRRVLTVSEPLQKDRYDFHVDCGLRSRVSVYVTLITRPVFQFRRVFVARDTCATFFAAGRAKKTSVRLAKKIFLCVRRKKFLSGWRKKNVYPDSRAEKNSTRLALGGNGEENVTRPTCRTRQRRRTTACGRAKFGRPRGGDAETKRTRRLVPGVRTSAD